MCLTWDVFLLSSSALHADVIGREDGVRCVCFTVAYTYMLKWLQHDHLPQSRPCFAAQSVGFRVELGSGHVLLMQNDQCSLAVYNLLEFWAS